MIVFCAIMALVGLALSAVFSGSETGLYCMNRVRLTVRAEKGDAAARRLLRLVEDEHRALATTLVGTNVFNYVITICFAYLLAELAGISEKANELYTTLIATPIVFVFGEVTPKTLFQRRADTLMLWVSSIVLAARQVFFVPVTVLGWISNPIIRWFDPSGLASGADPRRKVLMMLHDALASEDEESDKHRELVDGVMRLRRVRLHQVMTPRNKVACIHIEGRRRDCLVVARKNAHTRFPVYETDPRRIVGVVQIHRVLADSEDAAVRDYLEPTIQLSAHQTVASALVAMQDERVRLGVVADRSGLMLGIVTLKDLLEELTGELHAW